MHIGVEIFPTDRHRQRVHRVGEGDILPFEARLAHVDRCAARLGPSRDNPAERFDPGRPAEQQRDRAAGVAAALDLTAIGVEDPHAEIGAGRRNQQDDLVATDAGLAVG